MEHNQAPITFEDKEIFTVDEKLQSLIQFLWDKDFSTFSSCEDNAAGETWIEYAMEDWIAITEIAFRSKMRDLYDFIETECDVLLLSSDDGQPDDNDEYWIEGENLIWSASVRFGKENLELFEKLIRAVLEEIPEVNESIQ